MAPILAEPKSLAKQVRFDPSVSTLDKSTLMSHNQHPGAAPATPLRVEGNAPPMREPTYADYTATVTRRRRRQTNKNA
jgi:hypothetical protein